MRLNKEELHDAIDDGREIACEPWRWGTNRTYVFEKDGRHYRFTAQFHSQEGLQDTEADAVEVIQVERVVKEWVPGSVAQPSGQSEEPK